MSIKNAIVNCKPHTLFLKKMPLFLVFFKPTCLEKKGDPIILVLTAVSFLRCLIFLKKKKRNYETWHFVFTLTSSIRFILRAKTSTLKSFFFFFLETLNKRKDLH